MKKHYLVITLICGGLFFGCSEGTKEKSSEKDTKEEQKESSHEGHSHDHGDDHDHHEKEKEHAEKSSDVAPVTSEGTHYGDTITREEAISSEELMAELENKDSVRVKIQGKVSKVCQKMGCWMNMDMGEGNEDMMIRFGNHDYFIPKDAKGTYAYCEGKAFHDTVSVEMQKHFAKDAGKSEEEIEAIKEPKVTLAFKADGVILENR